MSQRKQTASLFVNTFQLQVTSVPQHLRLNYGRYLQHLFELYNIVSADAYSIIRDNTALFEEQLKRRGYRTHFCQFPTIALREDLERTIGNVDVIVLAATDRSLAPLLEQCKDKAQIVFYCGQVPDELAGFGTYLPLPEGCFREHSPTEPFYLPPSGNEPTPVLTNSSGKADEIPF